MTRILVVDDEPQMLRALRINLQARGYEVHTAPDGAAALAAARTTRPDLMVLDLGLPDMDGVDVIEALRAWTPMPIVVLSGRSDQRDKVFALDAGADDYVTKPFGINELLARVRAVTRRRVRPGPVSGRIGGFEIDIANHRVIAPDGTPVHLTKTEWQLIEVFVAEPGKLFSHRHLLQTVWGPTYHSETQYLRQYMAQLRRKFEEDPARPRHLITEPGMGYRLQP